MYVKYESHPQVSFSARTRPLLSFFWLPQLDVTMIALDPVSQVDDYLCVMTNTGDEILKI